MTRLLLGSSFHPGGIELTEQLARAVSLGPGDRVLDLACGRGDTAFFLAERYGVEVVGLDYSLPQVEEANEKAQKLGRSGRAAFVHGDAEKLPFEDGKFDIVICECALCTFPRREHAVAEARRVLKEGGRFALSDVVLNRDVPDSLQTIMGHVLCISGALSQEGYKVVLESGGFRKLRFRDASHTLMQLIAQMEHRLAKSSTWRGSNLAGAKGSKWTSSDSGGSGEYSSEVEGYEAFDREAVVSALQAARAFVEAGGLGYATFTAIK